MPHHDTEYDATVPAVVEEKREQPETRIFANEFDMSQLVDTVGTLELTDQQKEILTKPVDENDVEIRPDGLIYLPWMEYATRLNQAFGNGSWALVPQGMPRFSGNMIYWGHWLIVQGKMCGFAIGEQQYIPKNLQMTYGDACEGAWSNSLMRNCKHLGISLELWKPSFIRQWVDKYGEKYWSDKKEKYLWRKKGTDPTIIGPVNLVDRDIESEETAPKSKPKPRKQTPKKDDDFDKDKLPKKAGSRTQKQYDLIKKLSVGAWGEEVWTMKLQDLVAELLQDGLISVEASKEWSMRDASEIIDALMQLKAKANE